MKWKPISTASKTPDSTGITPTIILGFAPDEEGYTQPSREGYWLKDKWVSSLDPGWECPPQPTHWMELPKPPNSNNH